MKRALITAIATALALATLLVLAWSVSPWPRVLLIRSAFEAEADRVAAAMWQHVPDGVDARLDLAYDPGDPDALLDVFRPASAGEPLPVVVWFHGGAFISGRRADVAPYLHILAAEGFATVAVGYSLAPRSTYPTPVRQGNRAIGWLNEHAGDLGLDMSRVVLAGDSAGAQLAAQLALLSVEPGYAAAVGIAPHLDPASLRGTVLACGALDLSLADQTGSKAGAAFLRTVTWAYSGRRDFRTVPGFEHMSVAEHVTARFPPTFITAGNADPLLPHSLSMARRLEALGVETDTLFFESDRVPALGHEFQFDLDSDAGQEALARITAFLRRHLAADTSVSEPGNGDALTEP